MIITEDKVVTIKYTLKDNSGKILDTSKEEGLSMADDMDKIWKRYFSSRS